ncbi:MAG: hypothetical protein K9K88_11995 [Desulfobacterales bacterium]|nr:hypothetical protein [Desulfobacterales bacterium]
MNSSIKRKAIVSVVLAAVLALSATNVLDSFCRNTIDPSGETYLNETLKKALYTYGIARLSNGLISVFQSATVGVGVTVGFGEFLDPFNDLIERFSFVMLLSTASLGVQKVLMEIGSWLGLKILLSLSMLVLLIGTWLPRLFNIDIVGIGLKLLLFALFVRFLIPAVGVAGNTIDGLFLETRYKESIQAAKQINESIDIEEITGGKISAEGVEEAGFFDRIRQMTDTAALKAKFEAIKERLAELVPRLIDLIVVFVIQTILLPLIVLWIMMYLFRQIGGRFSERPYPVQRFAV